MAKDVLLEVCGISKSFESGRGARTNAVIDASFEIGQGQILVLAGESGSGKSTLARMLLGTLKRDSGTLRFMGSSVNDADKHDLERVRKMCSFVQQDPYDSINPRMRVRDVVAEPLCVHGMRDKKERERRVIEVLGEVGLGAQLAGLLPHELSGGQRQRVAIARALALRPSLIIADEPVSMLDVSVRAGILDLMRNLCEVNGVSFLYITHDLATARHFGHDIALMYKGRIVEYGPVANVLDAPQHPYTQALLDALPVPRVRPTPNVRILDEERESTGGCAFCPRCPYAVDACSKVPSLEPRTNKWAVACFVPIE